jgi:hypothetical protein
MAEQEKKPGEGNGKKGSTGNTQKEGRLVEAHTKVKCKDLRTIHLMLGHQATPQSLASH